MVNYKKYNQISDSPESITEVFERIYNNNLFLMFKSNKLLIYSTTQFNAITYISPIQKLKVINNMTFSLSKPLT